MLSIISIRKPSHPAPYPQPINPHQNTFNETFRVRERDPIFVTINQIERDYMHSTKRSHMREAVLASYAAASKRADAQLVCVKEQFLPALEEAKSALKEARKNQLPLFEAAYENLFIAAVRRFEQIDRQAHTTHGLAITAVLRDLDQRKEAINAVRESTLSESRAWYEHLCAQLGNNQDGACLPAFDTFKSQEWEADQRQTQELADSHLIYLADKERQDAILAQVLETATREKRQAIDEAGAEHQNQILALIPPLEAALAAAQTRYDRAMQHGNADFNRLRHSRLSIIGAFETGRSSDFQAIANLDRLD